MVYERAHSRDLLVLQQMRLGKRLPFVVVVFTLASMASMGLPGFSGFIAEIQVLIGSWQSFPTLAVAAGVGVLLSAAYALRALQYAFFGGTQQIPADAMGQGNAMLPSMAPVSLPERLGAFLLIAVILAVGLFPGFLLDRIGTSLNSPLFHWLSKSGP
jgi:NADH-quinone oxidoreductase subunit M